MQDQRPVFLNLFLIRFPMAAIISIAHRASGILMVLLIPAMVYLLDLSLASEQGFQQVNSLLGNNLVKLVMVLLSWALLHHLFAGIRYLFLDFDIGVGLVESRVTAWIIFTLAALLAAATGVWVLL